MTWHYLNMLFCNENLNSQLSNFKNRFPPEQHICHLCFVIPDEIRILILGPVWLVASCDRTMASDVEKWPHPRDIVFMIYGLGSTKFLSPPRAVKYWTKWLSLQQDVMRIWWGSPGCWLDILHTNKIMWGNFAHILSSITSSRIQTRQEIFKIKSFPSLAALRETPERRTNAGCYHDPGPAAVSRDVNTTKILPN